MKAPLTSRARAQQGVTLIVVLMILLIVTVLGIGAAQISALGERAGRSDRDYQIALQSAEAALVDGELDIDGPNTSANNRVAIFAPNANGEPSAEGFPDAGCNDGADVARHRGLCAPSITTRPVWLVAGLDTDTGNSGNTVEFGTFTGNAFAAGSSGVQPARAPRYIIEREISKMQAQCANVDPSKCTQEVLYRITAIGFGPRVDTQVVVQSVFRRD